MCHRRSFSSRVTYSVLIVTSRSVSRTERQNLLTETYINSDIKTAVLNR